MEHNNPDCEPCYNCYLRKCRCDDCKLGNRIYKREQWRKVHRPDNNWDNPRISAEKARDHLLALKEYGIGHKTMSQLTGLSENTLWKIRTGVREFVNKETETKILAVNDDPVWVRFPEDATNHLRWLQAKGIGTARIAEAVGVNIEVVRKVRTKVPHRLMKESYRKIMSANMSMFTTPNKVALRAAEKRLSNA